jgi:hypothetical protein
LRDDSAVKEFEALEEALEKELGPQPDESAVGGVNALLATASQQQVRMPSFVYDTSIYQHIERLGGFPDAMRARICFFGDKNNVLILDLERDEWYLEQLAADIAFEF